MANFPKKTTEKLLNTMATVAKKSVSPPNKWGWPPDCIGLFYQNKRPNSLRREEEDSH